MIKRIEKEDYALVLILHSFESEYGMEATGRLILDLDPHEELPFEDVSLNEEVYVNWVAEFVDMSDDYIALDIKATGKYTPLQCIVEEYYDDIHEFVRVLFD